MIIDADTHISPYGALPDADPGDITVDELLRRMDRAEVDQAVTWLRPPYTRQVGDCNRYVYESMKAHPDRILGFGWIDPHLGQQAMLDEVRRCHEDYGFFGIKLNGAQNEYSIDGEFAAPYLDAVAQTSMVIGFHIATDAYERTHPYRLGRIAARYPESRILMIHMGGVAFHDLSDAAIEVMAEHPNILGIGSAIRHVNVLKAIRELGAERVAFGSDTPFNLMHVEVAAYRAMLEGEVSQEEISAVMGGNMARLLGLEG